MYHRADLRLLADYHRLQDAGVAEADGLGNGAISSSEGAGSEGPGTGVQSVADFVDCFGLGLDEGASGIEGVYIPGRVSNGSGCGGGAGRGIIPASKKNRILSLLLRK